VFLNFCPLWDRCITKLLSELAATHFVATVFNICITHKSAVTAEELQGPQSFSDKLWNELQWGLGV
jgi:hypothetical protein